MNIGFVGGGNMAGAIIGGIIRSGVVDNGSVLVSDVDQERLTLLLQEYGVRTTSSNSDVAAQCDTIILAVKPQSLREISKPPYPVSKVGFVPSNFIAFG